MRDNQSLEIGELMGGFRLGGGGGVKFEKNGPDLTNHGWECLADSETHGSADRSWERDNFLASRQ